MVADEPESAGLLRLPRGQPHHGQRRCARGLESLLLPPPGQPVDSRALGPRHDVHRRNPLERDHRSAQLSERRGDQCRVQKSLPRIDGPALRGCVEQRRPGRPGDRRVCTGRKSDRHGTDVGRRGRMHVEPPPAHHRRPHQQLLSHTLQSGTDRRHVEPHAADRGSRGLRRLSKGLHHRHRSEHVCRRRRRPAGLRLQLPRTRGERHQRANPADGDLRRRSGPPGE